MRSYFDTFEHREKFMIEMEYADGGSLRDYIGRQGAIPIPESQVIWFAFQLFSGLQHVHAHSILHRDVKSENIFLTASGLLKLGDFGISKVLAEGATKAASVVGTPYYMAPEVFKGEEYGTASDIFSAGCEFGNVIIVCPSVCVCLRLCVCVHVMHVHNACACACACVCVCACACVRT